MKKLLLLTPLCFTTLFLDASLMAKSFYLQLLTILVVFIVILRSSKVKELLAIELSISDLLLCLFLVYISISTVFSNGASLFDVLVINPITFIIIYFIFRVYHTELELRQLQHIGIIVILISSLWGWCNYFNLIGYTQLISGSWTNTGTFSIFLGVGTPFLLAVFFQTKSTKKKILVLITLLSVLVLLLIGDSRTSWISAILGCFVITIIHYLNYFFKIWNNIKLRILILSVGTVVLIFFSWWLFSFKEASSFGRLYVYQHCLQIWSDNLVFGVGLNNFLLAMNNSQATQFANNPVFNQYTYAASDIEYAFNEYLHFSVELGIVGIVLLISWIISVIHSYRLSDNNFQSKMLPYLGVVTAVLVASSFSYPLHDPAIGSWFFISMALIQPKTNVKYKLHLKAIVYQYIYPILLFILCLVGYQRCIFFKSQYDWKEAYALIQNNKIPSAFREYDRLYKTLKYDRYFLLNFGAELSNLGLYDKSIEILEETKEILNNEEVYLYLGQGYWGIGNYKKAEECYKHAMHLVPYRFLTRYKLVALYHEQNKKEEALSMAKDIIKLEPKFPQEEVESIKIEMKNYISSDLSSI